MKAIGADQIRELVYGLDQEVPLLDGTRRPYVNFDNAATTPAFRAVVDCVNEALRWYSSIHRGTGFKSLMSSHLYERCREQVLAFAGADPSYHTAIFCANTTDAINRLCQCMPHAEDDVVLTTVMEHHSNLLPWRFHARVEHVQIDPSSGHLDMTDMESKLEQHRGKVRLIAVTGASNVTGIVPPLRRIAALAHSHGARILVDGAQLLAHRPLSMGKADDPEHIDFLAFSGHKMYAPYGSGVLIGPNDCFDAAIPSPVGGGTVELVTLNDVEWAGAPEKLEAGTPNLIGALALSKSLQTLQEIGLDRIAEHEKMLTQAILDRLAHIEGIIVYGEKTYSNGHDRVGVIPILSRSIPHGLLAAILGYEYGIGVRHGCFCAHPYTGGLLGLDDANLRSYITQIRQGNRAGLPGFVRISIGIYNSIEEVEYLACALREIHTKGPQAEYCLDQSNGEYAPIGHDNKFDSLFAI